MKLPTIVGLLSLSALALWGCEEQQSTEPATEQQGAMGEKGKEPAQAAKEAQPAPPPAAEAPKPPEISPKEVCEQATAAAKANDEAKLASLINGELSNEGAKEHLTTVLANATCGEPKIDGDRGRVPVTMGAGRKAKTTELPLVKSADGWKVDAAAFLEKNPAKLAKGKKGKGKKGKKK
jgi:hypothetical protein